MPPFVYGFLVSFVAEVTWDIIGTRLYVLIVAFPYRLIHKDNLPVGLCPKCHTYHKHQSHKGA